MRHAAPRPCPEQWLQATLQLLPADGRILLEAGPGWGKTTLAAYWFSRFVGPRAWLSLQPLDVHPHTLIQGLADAVAELTGCEELSAPAGGWGEPVVEHLLDGWQQALAQGHAPGLLVIDQAHLLLGSPAQPLLRRVLQVVGERLQVVLCGRQPLAPLLVPDWQALPLQLGPAELALTPAQVQALAECCSPPCPAEAAESLRNACAGWPGVCQLLLRQARSWPASLAATEQLVPLLEEWLAELSIPERRLLQAASVCEYLDWPLLQRVCGGCVEQIHWQALLQLRLLVESGAAGQWMLLPFLREALQAYWLRRDPQGTGKLQQRRIQVLLDSGNPGDAIAAALRDGDPGLVSGLLIHHGWDWVVRGMWVELGELLAVPGSDAVRNDPHLALLRAWWLLEYRRDSGACARWLDEVAQVYPTECQPVAWQRRRQILWAHIHYHFDDLVDARTAASQVLAVSLSAAETLLASWVLALAQLQLGELEAARCGLEVVVPQAHALGASHLGLGARLRLGQLELLQGELSAAEGVLRRTHEFAIAQRLTADRGMDSVWRGRAELCLLGGDFKSAGPLIAAGAKLMAPLGDYWQLPYRALGLVANLETIAVDELERQADALMEQLEQHFYARQWQYRVKQVLVYAANVLQECGVDQVPLLRRLRRLSRWQQEPRSLHDVQDNLVSAWVRLASGAPLEDAELAPVTDFLQGCSAMGLSQRMEWVAWLHRRVRQPVVMPPRALLAGWLEVGYLWDLLLSAPWLAACWPEWARDGRIATSVTAVGNLQRLQALGRRRPRLPERLVDGPPAGLELTGREWQVLELIGAGLSNEQIAARLFVALSTVKTHINRIYAKLGVNDRAQARRFWQQLHYRQPNGNFRPPG